jgi:phosphoribosylformylglycinamidine synthase
MNAAIVVFPGSNREQDARAALLQATGREPVLVWHRDTELPAVDLILIPGGFSYGDYLRCGAMARTRRPCASGEREEGRCRAGVCNGFQVLAEAGSRPARSCATPA